MNASTYTVKENKMENQRSVSLLIDSESIERATSEVGVEALWKAVGYLSTWNLNYPKVTIWIDPKDVEIQASYRDENDVQKYFICAVWHGDHYGFHS